MIVGGKSQYAAVRPDRVPTPSQADVALKKAIVSVAQPLGISVHDHIAVGKDGHAGFKGLPLI